MRYIIPGQQLNVTGTKTCHVRSQPTAPAFQPAGMSIFQLEVVTVVNDDIFYLKTGECKARNIPALNFQQTDRKLETRAGGASNLFGIISSSAVFQNCHLAWVSELKIIAPKRQWEWKIWNKMCDFKSIYVQDLYHFNVMALVDVHNH